MVGSTPSFTVSDFVATFNQSLDMLYPEVVIVGELSSYRISKGMWVYFDLKDEEASVKFFGTVRALPGPLEEGMILEVVGRPHLHPRFGFSVQFTVVQAVGEGSIKKAQQLLAAKLEKEGLFDVSRKRFLPFPPERIGLLTSKESAAYGDFMKIIAARWPRLKIELFNVQVQGTDAPLQISRGIEQANQKSDQLDALILIRGGGSADDLAAFDHEQVVRAVAASRIPTLVAIGHERDVCLSELAADIRASTPSNAAELLVPDRREELKAMHVLEGQLQELLQNFTKQVADDLQDARIAITELLAAKVERLKVELYHIVQLCSALDPRRPLEKGYVLVRDKNGKVVTTGKVAEKAVSLLLEFGDKTVEVSPKKT